MKFKLDENLGARAAALLRAAGHDVASVREQRLSGADDETIFAVCAAEGRVLVTLDTDFAQVLRFPPAQSAAVAVSMLPGRATYAAVERRLHVLLDLTAGRDLAGRLWIVEAARVRVHSDDD